jgi:deazaflavin-dependent oxidoreductase (nitroreductase family)
MLTAKRTMVAAHAALLHRTRGRVLAKLGGQPVLLLETVGRRTGAVRRTPVQYLRTARAYAVVAANGGAARPPAWFFNLGASRRGRILVEGRWIDVDAHESRGPERGGLWRQLTAANRYLERTQRKAGRELPVLVLEPADAS